MRVGISTLGRTLALLIACAAIQPESARGDLIFYTTQASFTTAVPGLPTEGFQAARVPANSFALVPGPINSTSNNAAFQPGDLLGGFSIASTGVDANTQMVITGTGTTPGESKEVGVVSFKNALDATFTGGVAAVGGTLIASAGPGSIVSDTFEISVYSGSSLIGMTSVSVSGANTFFGVDWNGVPITRVTVSNAAQNASVLLDNLTFGNPPSQAPVFYSTRSDFAATHSRNAVETFESARVAPGQYVSGPGPISSTTSSPAFQPGDLMRGFVITSTGSQDNLVVATGSGTIPGATKAVGAANPLASLSIALSPGSTSFGTDLIASVKSGEVDAATLNVSVFGAAGLISTRSVDVTGASTFFGIDTGGTAITNVTISNPNATVGGPSIFVDNLSLNAVPEPSSLVLIAVGLACLAVCAQRRGELRRSR